MFVVVRTFSPAVYVHSTTFRTYAQPVPEGDLRRHALLRTAQNLERLQAIDTHEADELLPGVLAAVLITSD